MASRTIADRHPAGIRPDRYERFLAFAAIALFALVAVALWRGRAQWNAMPALLWAHIVTVMIATGLTPVQLLRPRGGGAHRTLGWIWALALFATALLTFGIRGINSGALSPIHAFSALTFVMVPVLVLAAPPQYRAPSPYRTRVGDRRVADSRIFYVDPGPPAGRLAVGIEPPRQSA